MAGVLGMGPRDGSLILFSDLIPPLGLYGLLGIDPYLEFQAQPCRSITYRATVGLGCSEIRGELPSDASLGDLANKFSSSLSSKLVFMLLVWIVQ